jgi:hypothetical protein
MVSFSQNPLNRQPELLCASCAAKSTFHPRRANRMACYMCGNATFSGTHSMPGQTPKLQHGERFVVKCRRHRGLSTATTKCLLCTHMVDKRFGVAAVLCRTCGFTQPHRCCVME